MLPGFNERERAEQVSGDNKSEGDDMEEVTTQRGINQKRSPLLAPAELVDYLLLPTLHLSYTSTYILPKAYTHTVRRGPHKNLTEGINMRCSF